MQILDGKAYCETLLSKERPGAGNILAFYDHRVGAICRDPRLLLVPLDDHICHRGDGLFESLCYRDRRIFALDKHLARLMEGARTLKIQPPCSWEELRQHILDVAYASEQDQGNLRVFLSRGPGGFGITPEECSTAGLYIVALKYAPPKESFYAKGLTAFTSEIPPKQAYLARIKNTNYLPNVFMAAEAREKGYDVAVSFDAQGIMGEAAIANIALVSNEGCFVYPVLANILAGTTLLTAVSIARACMPVEERGITHEDIWQAQEVFLLTSSSLCVAITHFDDKPLGKAEYRGRPGHFALWLRDQLYTELHKDGVQF